VNDDARTHDTADSQPDETEARRARIVESMRAARGGKMYEEWEWAVGLDPDFLEVYANFSNTCWSPPYERALEPKFRELIAIVLLSNRGFHWSLAAHIRRARRIGASWQELIEALESAVIPGGAPVMHLGLTFLMQVYKEEEAARVQQAES
jgi:alkylhydroperoxidase/carboxymuconolactone decarboxylase family protein YurZ